MSVSSSLPYPSSPSSISGLAGTTPPLPLPRPTIPSWQLASSTPVTPAATSIPPATTTPVPVVPTPSTIVPEALKADKGKGKQSDAGLDPLASSGVLVSEAGTESESDADENGIIE